MLSVEAFVEKFVKVASDWAYTFREYPLPNFLSFHCMKRKEVP